MSNRQPPSKSRRAFLEQSSGLILGVCTASCRSQNDPEVTPQLPKQPSLPGPSTLPQPSTQPGPKSEQPKPVDINQIPMDFGPLPTQCPLVVPMTKGPCTAQADRQIRQDLREGWAGLQLFVGLRIVDANCQAVQGAQVSIWHANYEGSYSSQTPANDFCVFKPEYLTQSFFRGQQITNAKGEVRFLTCYPGWYPGRAVHIHLQVTHANAQSRATQLYFPAAYTQALFTSHPNYKARGAPDTPYAQDDILGRATPSQQQALTFDLKNEANVGLVALKTVSIVGG